MLTFGYLDGLLRKGRARKIILDGRQDENGNSAWTVDVITDDAVGHEIGCDLSFVILAALREAELTPPEGNDLSQSPYRDVEAGYRKGEERLREFFTPPRRD